MANTKQTESASEFFSSIVKDRKDHIEQSSTKTLPKTFPVNQLADALHPKVQNLKISKVENQNNQAKSFTLKPDTDKGTEHLAYFKAGQDIAVGSKNGGGFYPISSSPKAALDDQYIITVKNSPKDWQVGTSLSASGPMGHFCYQPLRDSKNVVGIAKGFGITALYSLIQAVVDGTENADNFTLLYENKNGQQILFNSVLTKLAQKSDKFSLVNTNHLETELISQYFSHKDVSIFIAGFDNPHNFIDKQVKPLNLPAGKVRFELGKFTTPYQEKDYPPEVKDKTFNITVHFSGKKKTFSIKSDVSLRSALKQQNISSHAHKIRVIKGKVFVPYDLDWRRRGDIDFHYADSSVSYPLSDLEIQIPNIRF